MIHTLQNNFQTGGGEDRLLDNVFAIIDSRIQYLEYQKETLMTKCLLHPIGQQPSKELNSLFSSETDSLLTRYERIQEKVSKMTHSVRLLLFIRSNLLQHNAEIALGLLTDGMYLNYSEEHLQNMLWSSRTVN